MLSAWSGPKISAAHWVALAGASLALLFACGCTLQPRYERPAAPVAASYPGAAGAQAGGAAAVGWRDFIHEPRLRALTEIALVNNRDLRVAILNVEQLQAQYRIARSASFPAVDATAGYTRSNGSLSGGAAGGTGVLPGSSTSTAWTASVGVSAYELDLFGRVRSLNRQALETYLATDEARRSTQIALVAEVATQYFALCGAEEQLALAQHTLGAVRESYEVNKATFAAGASNELDLRAAEGQVHTAESNVQSYQRQRSTAENGLVLLIGQPLPAGLPPAWALADPGPLAEVEPGLPSELILRRADILEAEHTLKASNANIGAARAALFPQITLTGSVGSTSPELSKLLGAGTGYWSFAPQLTLPIFSGGRLSAQLEAAKIGQRIEVAHYEKAIQTAFREVADALAEHESYAQQIDTEAKLAQAEQRRSELAGLRYRAGEESYLSVLSAQQDLYSAQQGLLLARYNQLASRIVLYRALGGGWK